MSWLIPVGVCADQYERYFSRAAARQPGAHTGQRKRRPVLRPPRDGGWVSLLPGLDAVPPGFHNPADKPGGGR
jgi:hypothetical protein